MATQSPGFSVSLAELAAALLAAREVAPRARLIAEAISQLLPGTAVVVYIIEDPEAPQWTAKAFVGDVKLSGQVVEFESGTLGELAKSPEPFVCQAADCAREDYAHLDVRRTLSTLAYLPLASGENLIGAIELVSFEQPLAEDALDPVMEIAEYASVSLASALAYENERNTSLNSISRVTQLYDLEKVLNSTLEMDELLPIISSKISEILDVQAVNLWMVQGDESVLLVSSSGYDPTVESGATQKPGDGIAGDVSDNGEAVVIESAEDERLLKRNSGVEDGVVFSLMAAPIIDRESLVGVIEVINKRTGVSFDEDDLFFLTTLCETAAGALHNASLLQAERKVEILEALVQVSSEITSTLNIERVLQAVVNGTQAVIPYERAAIALEHRGSLQLKAVSGMAQINAAEPSVKALKEVLEWASISSEPTYVTQRGDEIDDPREETRAKFAAYFETSGSRSIYILPLADDQGRVGMLSFESSDPDFLSTAHFEIIKVLAGQATVALRNAELYREVPFIGVLEPLLQKKQRFMKMQKRRRAAVITLAAAAVLFLAFVPLPMRVAGTANVAPAHVAQVQPEVDGVVRKVYVREGDPVTRGTILADLEDWNYRAELAAAEAKFNEAAAQMNKALASNDGTEAGIHRVEADYWHSEVTRARERLERTHLRAPIDGVVTTPHVENFAGRRLEHGDSFAEIANSAHATVDVAIDENEATLLQAGERASVKLDSFPTRTFRGEVTIVSPKAQAETDRRIFFARVDVPNADGSIRPGMQGQGKVSTGWHPAGYVLFRSPAMWFWGKLWSWFGW